MGADLEQRTSPDRSAGNSLKDKGPKISATHSHRPNHGRAPSFAYFNSGGDTFLIPNTDKVFHIGNTADFEMAIRLDGTYTPNALWFDL
jgi:hypothetical protein